MKQKCDFFYFRILNNVEENDITYKMSLGKTEFLSYITLWSNDIDSICAQLEKLLYEINTEIQIDFDTEPTKLLIDVNGDLLSVKIIPSSFHKLPPIEGICNKRDFIKTLYEGLLFGMTFCYDDVGCGWNWFDCKMVCYNLMKSRTIEEYLRTSNVKKVDNYVTKHILVYDGSQMLHICDETIGYKIPLSNTIHIKDKTGRTIAQINGALLKSKQYEQIATQLPNDFDFWVIGIDKDGYIQPSLFEREHVGSNQIFVKKREKYEVLGEDTYGFTSETLWHACQDLDFKLIRHFLSLGVDTTFFFRWVLSSDKDGATNNYGEPTYEDSEASFRKRDAEKAHILEYIITHNPKIELKEDMLRDCIWNYCPQCMKMLLDHGANPNEREIYKEWRLYKVKYRSVLNLLNTRIQEGKEKYGIYQEMKEILESVGAKDAIIWNDEYKEK